MADRHRFPIGQQADHVIETELHHLRARINSDNSQRRYADAVIIDPTTLPPFLSFSLSPPLSLFLSLLDNAIQFQII